MRPSARAVLTTAALALGATALTGVSPATATASFGYGAMTFTNSAAPAAFFGAPYAGEPSLGVDGRDGTTLYMSGTDVYKVAVDRTTSPVGVSWSNVTPLASVVNLDPILATDRVTGTTLGGGDTGPCGVLFRSTDGGASWDNSVPCTGAADHPTVGFGPTATGLVPALPTGNGRVAYFCQQQDVDVCSSSLDGGTTWGPGVPSTGCFGLFGHLKASTDGTAYVPSMNCSDSNGDLAVGAFSTRDNGATWQSYGILGATEPSRGFDPSITTTPDNTVYESWARAGDYHPVVTFSKDHGATWSPQVDLASTVSPPLVATTFQAMTSGDDGRVSVAYLGTTVGTPGVAPFDAGYHGVWNLYVSTTLDGGKTWTTAQATTEPVQRGSISDGGTTSTGQRNLLDFIDAQTLTDGRVAVAYADGCLDVCNGPNGTEAQSTASYATVAVQDTGRGLLSAYDVNPVTTAPAAPSLTATGGMGAVSLSWTTPADGGAPITGYQVTRNGLPLASVGTVTSYVDSTAVPGTTYSYAVAAVNANGPGTASSPASAYATTVPGAPVLTALAGRGQVSLSWTLPSDGYSPITFWTILRGTAPGTESPVQTLSTGTSYVDTTVTAGTTYYYEVVASNANGPGAPSNEVGALPRKGK
ncbi:MAG: fibronectin type III domain-containing protein [Mycobacteriales bacterium]